MGTGNLLMLISETLAVVAVATQFFLPERTGISLTLAHRTIALAVRWVIRLLLISVRWRIESHSSFQHVLAAGTYLAFSGSMSAC